MSRKKMSLFNIVKLNTSNIIKNNFVVELDFDEAKANGIIIALGDNQLLGFIRTMKDLKFNSDVIDDLYTERNKLKILKASKLNSKKIINIQKEIDDLLFVPDLVSIKVDTTKTDYKRICKDGFKLIIHINNKTHEMEYKRLCAGAGQLRRNSSLFVNKELYDVLEKVMMCGLTRAKIGKINLAKFSAYFSLYTSATNKVKKPRICVIKDFEYDLQNQKIAWIYDDNSGEKHIEERVMSISQNAFDGSGIISVEMANRWKDDLHLDYLPSSFIIRSAWIKGLVSVFDIKRFAKEIAKNDIIVDAWGKEYDINNIDVILPTSMFKMYKKYTSWDEYTYYHSRYNHIYGVARVNKKEDNFLTQLNYQYIQSNKFTEESIKGLADFSIDWVKKIMTCDKLYTMLFMLGSQDDDLDYSTIEDRQNSYISKVLMYNDSILNDDYVRNKIINKIEKNVNNLKIGKLFVEGSYDFAIPDLYAMCEYAFGMEVKGLLKAGESWNKRWVDKKSTVVSMQRSPLVAPSENQLRNISLDEKCIDWFSHIQSGMIMSIWDIGMMRCSDADYDGDLVLSSDNQYLINSIDNTLSPITYEKKKSKEQKLNFNSFASMDTKSFDSKIGFITNLASNFIAMMGSYSKDSAEYKELKKRVDFLRQYQGMSIDSTKGDVFIPPPKKWYKKQKFHILHEAKDETERDFFTEDNKRIAFENKLTGDKKAYFFGYVYPKYMTQFNNHKNNYKKVAKFMYGSKIYDIAKKADKTKEEKDFIYKYYKHMPLLVNKCTMNVLAGYVDDIHFDNKWKRKHGVFDYHILLSKTYDVSNKFLHKTIKNIITEFHKKYKIVISERNYLNESDDIILDSNDFDNFNLELSLLIQEYEEKLTMVHSNKIEVCNYIVDIYYNHFKTKNKLLLWGSFGDVILQNIKSQAKEVVYPVRDDNGVDYLGKKYTLKAVEYVDNI